MWVRWGRLRKARIRATVIMLLAGLVVWSHLYAPPSPFCLAPSLSQAAGVAYSCSEVGDLLGLEGRVHELVGLLGGGEALVDVLVVVVDEVLVCLEVVLLAL